MILVLSRQDISGWVWFRILKVLARIFIMPVQNSYSKSSAHPRHANLATKQLRISIPNTFNSLLCQKGYEVWGSSE